MTLTPADIHNTEFTKASLGRRGYDKDDVDVLLDEATAEMIRLLEENDALRNRLDAAGPDRPGRAARAELSAATAALDRARQACDRAEHDARLTRGHLDEARRAAAVAETARGEGSPERVLAKAQQTADVYVREAQEKSRGLLAEARDRADRMVRDAQDMVDAIDRKARDRRNEAAADVAGVVRDIDELARFAAEYHTALERHLRRQGQVQAESTLARPTAG
ncbi:DivIVA domain-containing protein [Actinoplanes sp. URMC 104]|uniref:DivIVA domain-containing protein n=1 Tax=Actinoplanes sp. URMC 104 TaxID=3423409 RepID=UPI003F1C6BBF